MMPLLQCMRMVSLFGADRILLSSFLLDTMLHPAPLSATNSFMNVELWEPLVDMRCSVLAENLKVFLLLLSLGLPMKMKECRVLALLLLSLLLLRYLGSFMALLLLPLVLLRWVGSVGSCMVSLLSCNIDASAVYVSTNLLNALACTVWRVGEQDLLKNSHIPALLCCTNRVNDARKYIVFGFVLVTRDLGDFRVQLPRNGGFGDRLCLDLRVPLCLPGIPFPCGGYGRG